MNNISNNVKIRNLIPNYTLVSYPFVVLGEIVRWQVPFSRRFKWFRRGTRIGKVDLDLLKESGYDGLELTLWGLFDETWDINLERLKQYKKSNYPFYTFHGCFESFPRKFKNAYLNLTEKNPRIIKAIKSHILVASELKKDKTATLVFHPGKILKNQTKEEAISNLIFNLSKNLDLAKEKGIIVTIENMPYRFNKVDFFQDSADFKYIFSRIQHPNLKITFDWGHLNTQLAKTDFNKQNKYKDYKKGQFIFQHINNFVNALGENIAHAHIHYNRSHEMAFPKLRAGNIKNFFIYLFFWTKFAKSIQKRMNCEFLDEHLSLEKIENAYRIEYEKTIDNLLKKSSILKYGFITHEIAPLRIFKIFIYQKNGAKREDLRKSLLIFKKMIKNYLK